MRGAFCTWYDNNGGESLLICHEGCAREEEAYATRSCISAGEYGGTAVG